MKKRKNEAGLGKNRRVTIVLKSARQQVTFHDVRHERFAANICRELRKIYKCIIADNRGDYSKLINLECVVHYDDEELNEI